MTETSIEHKRQRVSKACEQCRRKKVKCDGSSPQCNNCSSLNLSCQYKESTKKRGPPKGYIEAIEGRLHRLEALLGSIVQEDDPRSQAIMEELNAPLETAYGEIVRPKPIPLVMKREEEVFHSLENHSEDDIHNTLPIDESGQLRYYGKSAGFYMLKDNKQLQNKRRVFQFTTKLKEEQPFLVDPFEMPPNDLSQHLLDLYFTHFYSFLPILHKKSFLESLPSTPPLLLNAIYAVASRVSPDPRVRSDPSKPETAGDVFFERARLLLDLEWDSFKIYTVQALLLMSSHQNGALKTTRAWIYSGMAIRMSQNLGLHRNCDSWDLSAAEKEERKRVFYACFVIDRLSCSMHGRSPMIDERDYDTPYPSENDPDDTDRTPRIMENFYQLIKICEILDDVLRELYMVKGRKQLLSSSPPDQIVSFLDKKFNRWMSKLPSSLQYRPPNTRLNERGPAPSLELCQLHMLAYTTLILMHRPFIPGPSQSVSPSVLPSAAICTFAANKILDITESLLAEKRLTNVNNYSLFFMFTAGIIFIYNAASNDSMFAFEAKISINKIMRAMDEVEKTWITSARHCNILGALAGLRDIELDRVDESYTKQQQEKMEKHSSIAVPNSPPPTDYQRMEEKYYTTSLNNNEEMISPELTQSSVNSPYQFQQQQRMTTNIQESFDPNETEFWQVPMSFDIDEWNSYFSNQKNNTNSPPIFADLKNIGFQ